MLSKDHIYLGFIFDFYILSNIYLFFGYFDVLITLSYLFLSFLYLIILTTIKIRDYDVFFILNILIFIFFSSLKIILFVILTASV